MNRYPRGQNPVRLNDIFFSFHAGFATIITVYQCVIYEVKYYSSYHFPTKLHISN